MPKWTPLCLAVKATQEKGGFTSMTIFKISIRECVSTWPPCVVPAIDICENVSMPSKVSAPNPLPPDICLTKTSRKPQHFFSSAQLKRQNSLQPSTHAHRCPFWLFCKKNRWRFLVYLVVFSHLPGKPIYPLKGHLCPPRTACLARDGHPARAGRPASARGERTARHRSDVLGALTLSLCVF